jgi:hypothetical protein
MSPNAEGWGGGGCGVSANEYSCAHGAKINFGDLIPYFMSFCRILPTLWSQAAFHNIPHFFRGRQKSGMKSTV